MLRLSEGATMTKREPWLKLVLRLVGTVSACAAFCSVMPYAWMNATHQYLGMGVLPDRPVVGYLARSTSAFYALFGGLFWVVSFDLPRYRPVLRYLGVATVVLGILLFGVDRMEGMPLFWQIGEGPIDVAIGAVLLWLGRAVREG